jgi:hypothetical protein
MKFLLFIILASASSAIELGCNFSLFSYPGTFIRNFLTCFVTSVDFSNNSTHITGSNGSTLELESTELIYFGLEFYTKCSELNITTIPQGGLDVFPSLIGFIFRNCSLNHLSGNELDNYPNFEVFMNFDSKIEIVPGNFFNFTPNMRIVSFWSSGVKHVGKNFMDGLNHLMHVWFYNNLCIDEVANNSTEEINSLIEKINLQCQEKDFESTTGSESQETTEPIDTTELPTTTETTFEPLKCEFDDINDLVCRHDQEIEELKFKVEDLQSQIDELKESNKKFREFIEKYIVDFDQ